MAAWQRMAWLLLSLAVARPALAEGAPDAAPFLAAVSAQYTSTKESSERGVQIEELKAVRATWYGLKSKRPVQSDSSGATFLRPSVGIYEFGSELDSDTLLQRMLENRSLDNSWSTTVKVGKFALLLSSNCLYGKPAWTELQKTLLQTMGLEDRPRVECRCGGQCRWVEPLAKP